MKERDHRAEIARLEEQVAQSGHFSIEFRCPLLAVKQTSCGRETMSASDPKRTLSTPLDSTKSYTG
jgi:hypothetical protein